MKFAAALVVACGSAPISSPGLVSRSPCESAPYSPRIVRGNRRAWAGRRPCAAARSRSPEASGKAASVPLGVRPPTYSSIRGRWPAFQACSKSAQAASCSFLTVDARGFEGHGATPPLVPRAEARARNCLEGQGPVKSIYILTAIKVQAYKPPTRQIQLPTWIAHTQVRFEVHAQMRLVPFRSRFRLWLDSSSA